MIRHTLGEEKPRNITTCISKKHDEGVDWILVTQDWVKFRAVLNEVTNYQLHRKRKISLSAEKPSAPQQDYDT